MTGSTIPKSKSRDGRESSVGAKSASRQENVSGYDQQVMDEERSRQMRQNEDEQEDQGFEDQIPYEDAQDMEGQEQFDPN